MRHGWTATDRKPLPFESSFGAICKFAWHNQQRTNALRRLLKLRSQSSKRFDDIKWLHGTLQSQYNKTSKSYEQVLEAAERVLFEDAVEQIQDREVRRHPKRKHTYGEVRFEKLSAVVRRKAP